MKEFLKSVNIWRRYELEYGVSLFLTHGVFRFRHYAPTPGVGENMSLSEYTFNLKTSLPHSASVNFLLLLLLPSRVFDFYKSIVLIRGSRQSNFMFRIVRAIHAKVVLTVQKSTPRHL